MRSRQPERRPARQIGPMVSERVISNVPSFVALLHRFGFIDREAKLKGHAGWSEYTKVENDLVVTRIRQQLLREGKLVQRSGLFDNVRQTEQALASMSEDQLLRCRARYFLNDFRLTPADREETK
jgi:hypothetical protein